MTFLFEDLTPLDLEEAKTFHSYTVAFENGCFAQHFTHAKHGYVCTREEGHKGNHAALTIEGRLIKIWENTFTETKVAAPEFFT